MTCIVGLEHPDGVLIGGDSAGVSGHQLTIRADEKVWRTGEFVYGFTSSFRMGQLLRYKLEVPRAPAPSAPQRDLDRWMTTEFIDAIRKDANGYALIAGDRPGAITPTEAREKASMGAETQTATAAVAEARGIGVHHARTARPVETRRVREMARQRAEDHGTSVEEEAPKVAEWVVKSEKANERRTTERKEKLGLRFVEMESKLTKAKGALIDALRKVLKDGGLVHVENGVEQGGHFLVGWRGTLYHVEGDFQVGRATRGEDATGCGDELALGALFASRGRPARARVKLALEAAAAHSGSVAPPFRIVNGGKP